MSAPATTPRPFRAAGPTEALRALALGANLWAVALLLPVVHGGARGVLDLLAAPAPLVPLALGALALAPGRGSPPRRRGLAIAMLLLAFPVALAIVLASRADLSDRDAWGPVGLAAAALSLLAYGAVSAEACARPLVLRTSTAQGLAIAQPAREPDARRWLRRSVLAMTSGGALLAAVAAPALGSRATLLRVWGESADEATVLASVVGATVGAVGIAAIVGPRLRAPRAGELPAPSRRALRVSVAMLLASVALVSLLVLRALEEAR